MGQKFWQHWQQYRDYLYRCCIKWMGNPTDAEDALSRAMLKAWEKVQKYAAGEITNFKAWLTSLTKNLCVDIDRERARGANRVENIEVCASSEDEELVSPDETPESALEADEKKIVIRRAIENLPPRLRETFIPHDYKDLSYLEIAQKQGISYQNVCLAHLNGAKDSARGVEGIFYRGRCSWDGFTGSLGSNGVCNRGKVPGECGS
jgi:RNA polymerase sigma-70 factor (ECF subfamily)